MKIHIQVLGSTSSGNCTAIWNSTDSILVDCGFSARYICQHLEHNRQSIHTLAGVLITHTHTDHVHESMLTRLYKERVPVYCHHNVGTVLLKQYAVIKKVQEMNLLRTFRDDSFMIGSFTVHGFEVPHDAQGGCFGFTISHRSQKREKKIVITTDMGYPYDTILTQFHNADVIIIESNHDQEMLAQSSRPVWLKKRIKKIGHLSNDQCAGFIEQVLLHSQKIPHVIILAHISQECNTSAHAVQSIQTMLKQNNYSGIKILHTHRRKATTCISI